MNGTEKLASIGCGQPHSIGVGRWWTTAAPRARRVSRKAVHWSGFVGSRKRSGRGQCSRPSRSGSAPSGVGSRRSLATAPPAPSPQSVALCLVARGQPRRLHPEALPRRSWWIVPSPTRSCLSPAVNSALSPSCLPCHFASAGSHAANLLQHRAKTPTPSRQQSPNNSTNQLSLTCS